jgi:hypothetical protein
MSAIAQAPWSLRAYAALVVGTGLAVAVFTPAESSWVRVLWAVVFAVCVCTGNRFVWWFVVTANAVVLVASPFLFGQWLAPMALSLAGLVCLLAPASRDYVFTHKGGVRRPNRSSGGLD